MKIAICIPCHGDTKRQFTEALARMLLHTAYSTIRFHGQVLRPEIELFTASTSHLGYNRTALLRDAIGWGADYILWTDADHTFPRDALVRLLAHGKQVVGVNYPTRSRPSKPTALRQVGAVLEPVWTTEMLARERALEEVHSLGLGFCLVNIAAVSMWADHSAKVGGQDMLLFNASLSYRGNVPVMEGEDTDFFNQLRAAGVQVFLDHALSWEVGHIGEHVLTNADALTDRSALEAIGAAKG